jgi:hypothetical protein
MNINPIRDVFFDDKATLAMGIAFDQCCKSLRLYARDDKVRALIAKSLKRLKMASAIRSVSSHEH